MDLVHYACMTAAGPDVAHLMQGLYEGKDHSTVITGSEFLQSVLPGGRVCFLQEKKTLTEHFKSLWSSFLEDLPPAQKPKLKNLKTLLLFSSTKGGVENFIWDEAQDLKKLRGLEDPFEKHTRAFCEIVSSTVASVDSLVISNACASSHVAFEMAQVFLNQGDYDAVFVVAADLIGPFIYQGFRSLKILSATKNKPFAADRDGLQLGEAMALLFFVKESVSSTAMIRVKKIATETEGGSVTAPSVNGEGLTRVLKKVMENKKQEPDFIVAHATGTRFNDVAEALALRFFQARPPVVGIKWSVGHTLGVSGALDLIVASEVLKNQKIFCIQNSKNFDSSFELNFSSGSALTTFQSAVISSLGFGGIHAALLLERGLV